MGGAIAALLIGIYLIGSEHFGYMTMLLSFSLLIVAINNGSYTILVRHLHEIDESGRGRKEVWLGAGLIYTFVVSALLLLLIAIAGENLIDSVIYFGQDTLLGKEIKSALYLLAVATTFDLFSMLAASALEGAGRFDLAAKGMLFYSVSLITGMLLMLGFAHGVSIPLIACVYLISSIVRVVVMYLVRLRVTGLSGLLPSHVRKGSDCIRSLLSEGGRVQGAGLLTVFVDPMNKMLINFFIGPSAVTHYDLAMRAVTSVQNVFAQGFRSFMAVSSSGTTSVTSIYRMILGHALGMAMLMYVIAATALVLLKGMAVIDIGQEVIWLFWIVLPSGVAIVAILPLYHVLIRRGDLNYILRLKAFLAIVNVGFSALAIPVFGLLGAGGGIAMATLINAILVYRRFHTWVEPLEHIASSLRSRSVILAATFVAMISMPQVILVLFRQNASVALVTGVVTIAVSAILLLLEGGSIWRRRSSFV